ncbi:hypothetical protein LX97_01239 [Nonlabens dokdonensis]|uniref:SGNH hydrolase-type esterase domain-containing protein n=2 Tax=Nonlabens dokdonensis TaxID=328515 RepID=L7WCE1_NONDD|nr:hypothetical protein [Nonlabens dokdonensis]AGC76578.1 hypothetical protein DDD_1451 [Nonlabens dokdonensis DSW-6]PZX44229.1 hypothetical protein LX97_01239 [Nonlabens dokdonensis]
MKKLLVLSCYLCIISGCSDTLDKYEFQNMVPSKSLIHELKSSKEKIKGAQDTDELVIKIQFHGQSIVKGIKEKRIKSTLENAFPHVEFNITNTARSGFQVPRLLPLMESDIYPEQADVLFFHAYGGTETGELDQFLKNLKINFKGDVIIFNHHLSFPDDPEQNQKLTKLENHTSVKIEKLANYYGFGFIDMRSEWATFIRLNKSITAGNLLRDGIHPNEEGKLILEHILMTHFIDAINTI